MTTTGERFKGTTLEERVPECTEEELHALVEFFDADGLRHAWPKLIELARAELARRGR